MADFIMTIEDENVENEIKKIDIQDNEMEDNDKEFLDPSFSFDYEEQQQHPWDLKVAKKGLREDAKYEKHVDDKIKKQLEKKQLQKEKSKQKRKNEENNTGVDLDKEEKEKKKLNKKRKREESDEEIDLDEFDFEDGESEDNGGLKFEDETAESEEEGEEEEEEEEDNGDMEFEDETAKSEEGEEEGEEEEDNGDMEFEDETAKSEEGEEEESEEEGEGKVEFEDETEENGDKEEESDEFEQNKGPEDRIVELVKKQFNKSSKDNEYFERLPQIQGTASFEDLKLARPFLKAVGDLGYKVPTPIQSQTIPVALMGKDICGSAVTGSGKTAAFALPILHHLLRTDRRLPAIRAIVLVPTRELAVQCHSTLEKLAKYTDIRCCLVIGGLSNKSQETILRGFPDIVVATPGRLVDHLRNSQSVGLDNVEILVLDEADRLLELGFTEEVEEIVKYCPKERQTLLFSATMTEEVGRLIKLSLNHPVRIAVDPTHTVADTLTQEFIKVKSNRDEDREAILLALCSRTIHSKALIFFPFKHTAHRFKLIFGLSGLNAAELHGNLTQNQRLDALEKFRDGKADYLLVTDLAARGLDILGIETVINYTMPHNLTDYIHRVGRTARAGEKGKSITLVGEKDRSLMKKIIKRAKGTVKNRIIPSQPIQIWKQKISELEENIQEILNEEREEKELRKAEMEMTKAHNMMEHTDEIYSRPKKSWFLTTKEKNQTKEKSKSLALGETEKETQEKGKSKAKKKKEKEKETPVEEKKGKHRLTRKKKRRIAEKENAQIGDREMKLIAKSAKKKFREAKQGLKPKESTIKPKKKKQKIEGKSNFEEEIKTSNFKTTRDSSNKRKRDKMERKFQDKSKKPHKKRGAFKSKKKFKRRK